MDTRRLNTRTSSSTAFKRGKSSSQIGLHKVSRVVMKQGTLYSPNSKLSLCFNVEKSMTDCCSVLFIEVHVFSKIYATKSKIMSLLLTVLDSEFETDTCRDVHLIKSSFLGSLGREG